MADLGMHRELSQPIYETFHGMILSNTKRDEWRSASESTIQVWHAPSSPNRPLSRTQERLRFAP